MLTGVFPKSRTEEVTKGPLSLALCYGEQGNCCGLLQLSCSYDLKEMYGENYGYRSGLNKSMVDHLHGKIRKLLSIAKLQPGDLVLDIGSNDGTTLAAYPQEGFTLLGIDPTGAKFQQYYPPHIELIAEFFSSRLLLERYGTRRAKVVTSFSMFYDLEQPVDFMREVHEVLHDEGLWVFEQSYMPTMLETNSYDTICQEHLEYYGLEQIKWMADRVGFKIIQVEFNDINGGSFSVAVAKRAAAFPEAPDIAQLLEREQRMRLRSIDTYQAFAGRVEAARKDLVALIRRLKQEGKRIYGLGASTKGNVILQYCGITSSDIEYIGEVNSEKFGCYTPGTFVPIIPEDELLSKGPDYLLVLPWHFRQFFEASKKFKEVRLVFPLPSLQITNERTS
jgi:NDP-4-keto-2,6-dideoxyhexose 3-C-methyltransferase